MSVTQPEGNYFNKYESSSRAVQLLMAGFFKAMDSLVLEHAPEVGNIYEGGCGEGFVSAHLHESFQRRGAQASFKASDLSENKIAEAAKRFPQIAFETASIYEIPEKDNAFDLAVASEVLEHMDEPEKALKEVLRISRKYILVSVPNEPIWRVLNMARGKYLKDFGNTPGHIQHWTPWGFRSFIARHARIIAAKQPFPWTMILAEKLPAE